MHQGQSSNKIFTKARAATRYAERALHPGPDGSRTRDLLLTRQAHYHLCYGALTLRSSPSRTYLLIVCEPCRCVLLVAFAVARRRCRVCSLSASVRACELRCSWPAAGIGAEEGC